jgi:hypothetical protein
MSASLAPSTESLTKSTKRASRCSSASIASAPSLCCCAADTRGLSSFGLSSFGAAFGAAFGSGGGAAGGSASASFGRNLAASAGSWRPNKSLKKHKNASQGCIVQRI